MRSANGCVISFNGEIYNYQALRRELEGKGHTFSSNSDTEVLLRLYEDRGSEMVKALRGMFAFALWDERKRGLLLARDHFGIKPLYFADDGRSIRVASEVKALLAGGAGISTDPDAAGHVGFFIWGHVPEPFTLYKSIRALPAGSTLWIAEDVGASSIRQYASVGELFAEAEQLPAQSMAAEDVRLSLRDEMLDTVRHHLVSDVEVGVFLSAGLDSGTLLGLASEIGGRMRTVTLGFDEYRGTARDETPLAESIARQYGAKHETVWITKKEFQEEIPRLFARMDQPSIDGVNSYFVARATAKTGLKVALSGLGGDELFGGYPSFEQIPRLVSMVRHVPAHRIIGRGLRAVSAPLLRKSRFPKHAGLLEYGSNFGGAYLLRRGLFLPWELNSLLSPDLVRTGMDALGIEQTLKSGLRGVDSERFRISTLEANWYMRNQLLRDTDWASMSHSLEVRVPLVDWTLWGQVAKLIHNAPGLNKKTMASVLKAPLPSEVLNRPKTGFHVPTREWMLDRLPQQHGLRGWATHIYEAALAA